MARGIHCDSDQMPDWMAEAHEFINVPNTSVCSYRGPSLEEDDEGFLVNDFEEVYGAEWDDLDEALEEDEYEQDVYELDEDDYEYKYWYKYVGDDWASDDCRDEDWGYEDDCL